jgi:hypothetical protein
LRASLLLPTCALIACGHQDGLVGVRLLGEAGADATGVAGAGPSSAGASALGFVDDFSKNTGRWQPETAVPGAGTAFGEASPGARDGRLATLILPGHPEYASADQAGADFVTQLGTFERFHFGTYRTRIGFGACSAGEETVMAFLGYFNDGEDRDGDGIVDDLEIDAQVLCGEPGRIYLTVFTDYEATGRDVAYRKLSRMIDFATGDISDTVAPDDETFAAAGNDPALANPTLFAPGALYELGFEWHADSIRFFLLQNGGEHELWTLTGADRVPQQPVHIVYNMWHPETHWYPRAGSADYPAQDVIMSIDWLSFVPE